MSGLIDELKKEHSEILAVLSELMGKGITLDDMENNLLLAKDLILNHLQKEDKTIYPILKEAAKNNDELQAKLERFEKDRKKVTQFSLKLFHKYLQKEEKIYKALDIEKLIIIIRKRIEFEENDLFPEYKKYINKEKK